MATHTPGKWQIEVGGAYPCIVADGFPGAIAVVKERTNAPTFSAAWKASLPEAEANARLIAAAPDLLAALKGLMDGEGDVHDKVVAARAAIAKAEGR